MISVASFFSDLREDLKRYYSNEEEFFSLVEENSLYFRTEMVIENRYFMTTGTLRSHTSKRRRDILSFVLIKNKVNAAVYDPVSVCGHFFIFSSIDEANDEKLYDNHYKRYPEWIWIRIDMNYRCEFWVFLKWISVFDVSITVRAMVAMVASILLEIVLTVALRLSMEKT